jgi:hypothetical protein
MDPSEVIAQIEAGVLSFRQLKDIAEKFNVEAPANTGKKGLKELLLAELVKAHPTGPGAASSPGSVPEPGPAPPRDPAPSLRPAELVLDEDADVVTVFGQEDARTVLTRGLGGVRGEAARQVVARVKDLAKSEGYVVRKSLRRISRELYGL